MIVLSKALINLEETTAVAKKTFEDYLPEKDQREIFNVQGEVPKDLAETVKRIMKKRKITWNELLTASLERFVDEMGEKDGGKK